MTTAHERLVTLRSLTGSRVAPPTVGYRQTPPRWDATGVAPRHRPWSRLSERPPGGWLTTTDGNGSVTESERLMSTGSREGVVNFRIHYP